MSHDILSDLLRTVRLRSALFYYVACGGNWAAEAPASRDVTDAVMPDADQVIEYHVVTGGECWAAVVGEPPLKLGCGDILLLPHGDAHVISSAPGLRAAPDAEWMGELQRQRRPFLLHRDGADVGPEFHSEIAAVAAGGADTTLVCGFIGCDRRPFNPLIEFLPRMLHLPAEAGGGWGEQFVQLAVAESSQRRPGGEALLERLSEMMFVDAVRRHVDGLPEQSTGWLAGLRDRHVGRALACLHENPAEPWTVDELGRRIGLSRSALHDRFVALIGHAPMQYLARWRMQLAARWLRDSQLSVLAIALKVGYESEAAFSRAFKRLVGMPPSAWRRAVPGQASRAGLSVLRSSASDSVGE